MICIPKKRILVLLLFFSGLALGQTRDLLSWNKLKIGYEPSKNWDLAVEGQFRLKNNVSVIDEYFGELQIDRRLIKGLKLGLGLRYLFENDTRGNIQGIENHFRYHVDLLYKHDVGSFDLKYRLRFQNKNELGVDDDPKKVFRIKGAAEYKIKNWKLDPEFAVELFSKLSAEEEEETEKIRLTLGTEYKLKDAGKFGIFYRIQGGFQQENRRTRHIIGLGYSYTFK